MKKNAIAIIQARMGSTRLPGKVLMDVCGKPVLEHVIERTKKCKKIDSVIVATTNKAEDKPIIKLAEECGVKSFAGSEEDVLDRYYQAAKKFKANIIIRINGDSPLIDPELMTELVEYYLNNQNKLDYLARSRSYDGLDGEVFSFTALEKSWREAGKPSEREHVTPYIWNHPQIFRLLRLRTNHNLPHSHWSVDEKCDLRFVREIYKNLYKSGKKFYLADILNLFKKQPELMKINKGLSGLDGYYKSLKEDKKKL